MPPILLVKSLVLRQMLVSLLVVIYPSTVLRHFLTYSAVDSLVALAAKSPSEQGERHGQHWP